MYVGDILLKHNLKYSFVSEGFPLYILFKSHLDIFDRNQLFLHFGNKLNKLILTFFLKYQTLFF